MHQNNACPNCKFMTKFIFLKIFRDIFYAILDDLHNHLIKFRKVLSIKIEFIGILFKIYNVT